MRSRGDFLEVENNRTFRNCQLKEVVLVTSNYNDVDSEKTVVFWKAGC